MYKEEAIEAQPIVAATLIALLEWVPMRGREGSDLRSKINDVRLNAFSLLQSDTLGPPLSECFELSLTAGINFDQLERVRRTAASYTPLSAGAILVKNSLIQFALLTQGMAIAEQTFTSRQDVDQVKTTINASFSAIEEELASSMDAMTYRAVVSLHAAISFYLIETARPLPQMLNFRFNLSLPTLTLSQRLYYTAARADELRRENKIVHPAFAQPFGRALSS